MEKIINHKKIVGMFILFSLLLASSSVSAYSSVGSGICDCGDGTTTDGGSATDACADCTAALNDNTNCINQVNYVGAVAISNQVGNCIDDPANFNNKIFDCREHTIDGDGSGSDYGIILKESSGNTIRNCIITDFGEGIDLRSSSNNNNLINNIANNNSIHGIYVGYSSGNTLTGNTANNNQHNGLYITGPESTNTIESNTFCNNNQAHETFYYDIVDLATTTGDDNTCDTTDNYNDAGTTGCTYSCNGMPVPEFSLIALAAVLLTTPAFAYLIVRRRK